MKKILIVGGVAGGATAAARLRRLDEHSEIIIFERGEYISFANCGLPYYIGGEIKEKSALTLQTPQSFYSRFRVEAKILHEVMAINRAEKTVTVKNITTGETYNESYDKLILSTGAAPIMPNIKGADNRKIFTLRNIPDTYKIKNYIEQNAPKKAVVVGGGYIGIEMAENLKNAGLDVTVVEMADHVIAPLDYDMASDIHNHLAQKGVRLLLGDAVKGVADEGSGLSVELNNGEIKTDMLIMAAGVRPDSGLAKSAGLNVNERGSIIVNENMQTSDENIYAAGDAVEVIDFVTGQKSSIPLAGPANKQGRIAADNICGLQSKYEGTQGSAILRVFDMTVATTGINEKTAKRLNINYDKSFTYSASHAGYYPGAVNMTIKIIFEKNNGKILGAQITGYEGVDKRCDILATAIRAGMTAYDLTKLELCYSPPYSSAKDPVNMAGFVIENILTGKMKNFHWHDVANLPRDNSVILLDTRTVIEYENGHIDGFINIPLDELRGRLSELDKNKKIYVTCQVGLRGYIASRILTGNGFDVYNLNGGYHLYSLILGEKKAENMGADSINIKPKTQGVEPEKEAAVISIDAGGLQCPGPIMKLSSALKDARNGDIIEIMTTDPAFAGDIEGFCRRTGNQFLSISSSKGISTARVKKADAVKTASQTGGENGKNFIVFSGDLDKAIASFVMANAAAALGRKVSMFFTFWGLNILRRPKKVRVKKDFISKMFGMMMPSHLGDQRLEVRPRPRNGNAVLLSGIA